MTPATTRFVIRRIGYNAVDRASRFFCRQGEYVEIMVNNVTVILIVRFTLHPLARTVAVSEVITIARVYFGCDIVSTVDRLNNTTQVCATMSKNVRLVDRQHNASCTLPN